jgi:hypothetical protein
LTLNRTQSAGFDLVCSNHRIKVFLHVVYKIVGVRKP